MAFFEWSDEYSVGIPLIDTQHKVIVGLMNELVESLRDKREGYIIADVVAELRRYSEYHFELEASLFRKYGYRTMEFHLNEHAHFAEKVELLSQGLKDKMSCVPTETLDYLCGWFKTHMLKADIDYRDFFAREHVLEEVKALA